MPINRSRGSSISNGRVSDHAVSVQTCNEGESHDRNEHLSYQGLGLPGAQQALVEAVAAVNPHYVVVLINGGALGIDWIKQNSPAVVEAF